MSDKVTVTVRAEELPKSLAAGLIVRPIPGTLYRVTAEPVEETEAEKLASLRAHVMRGLADAEAGRLSDEDEVFAELQAKYPDPDP